ncbi:MAG: hypothetical protein MHM6MM_005673, partial [Cercozoa sp. M6MM]
MPPTAVPLSVLRERTSQLASESTHATQQLQAVAQAAESDLLQCADAVQQLSLSAKTVRDALSTLQQRLGSFQTQSSIALGDQSDSGESGSETEDWEHRVLRLSARAKDCVRTDAHFRAEVESLNQQEHETPRVARLCGLFRRSCAILGLLGAPPALDSRKETERNLRVALRLVESAKEATDEQRVALLLEVLRTSQQWPPSLLQSLVTTCVRNGCSLRLLLDTAGDLTVPVRVLLKERATRLFRETSAALSAEAGVRAEMRRQCRQLACLCDCVARVD